MYDLSKNAQIQRDLQCLLYICPLISRHGASIFSITTIPPGQKHKQNKKLSQVVLIGDLGDKTCAYSYLEQNEIEENVIVSVCGMTLAGITYFPLRITRDR